MLKREARQSHKWNFQDGNFIIYSKRTGTTVITELFVNTLQFLKALGCNIMKFNCNSLTGKYLRTFYFCLGDSKVHWVRIFWSFIAFSSSSWYFLRKTLPIQNWLMITLWSFASCLQFVFAELTLLLIYRALKQSRGICSSPQSCQNDKTLCIDITVQVLLFWGFATILHGNWKRLIVHFSVMITL